MANETWNSYCGCTEQVTPCNTVFQKVDELPPLGDATRNHAYILPDNSVWVVNTEGTGFSQLNGGGGGSSYDDTAIKERLEALEDKTDNDTIYDDTSIKERLDALEEKTDNDTIYDDSELRDLIQGLADRNNMEDNRLVRIENKNATQDERLNSLEAKADKDTTYTAGNGITISEDNVISATGGGAEAIEYTAGNEIEITPERVINHFPKMYHRILDTIQVNDTGLGDSSLQAQLGYSSFTATGISLDFKRLGVDGNYTDQKNVYELIISGLVPSSIPTGHSEAFYTLAGDPSIVGNISLPKLRYDMAFLKFIQLDHYIEAIGGYQEVGNRYLVDAPTESEAKVFLDVMERDDEGNYYDIPEVRLVFKITGEDYYVNKSLVFLER